MDDYGLWLSLRSSGRGSREEEIPHGVVPGGYCHKCGRVTNSYFENHEGHIMQWCNVCGKRKWGDH